ncbi:MAG TPA: hypothetical protein VMP13_03720 [Acidimicrobiia bacterium]|nr:hypothetical protein [Acidimicrobiia bacterium]
MRGRGHGQRHDHRAALTGTLWLDLILALIVGVVIWRVSTAIIRILSTPPPEVDPEDIVIVDQDYKCTVCGAELTMRAVNPAEDKPPKHCREEMVAVWRP